MLMRILMHMSGERKGGANKGGGSAGEESQKNSDNKKENGNSILTGDSCCAPRLHMGEWQLHAVAALHRS